METHLQLEWPTAAIIGVLSTGDLVFLPAHYATAAAEEMDRWRQVSTWQEARALVNSVRCLPIPFHFADLTEDEDGDAPFDLNELGVVADGDWPPMPQALALELVQARRAGGQEWAVGIEADTALNGPMLIIGREEEVELIRALEASGCEVRRDDDLVQRATEV